MTLRRAAAGVLLLLVTASVATAQAPDSRRRLLDVPFYAQAPLQCGSAALAMVLRYWGHPTAVPADFADLVDEGAGGIRAADLTSSAGRQGWQAHALRAPAAGALDLLASHLARGRPVIALIDDGAPVLHYVVVVGMTDEQVLIHDPAGAPYAEIPIDQFGARWQRASNWMLLVLPPSGSDGMPLARADRADVESTSLTSRADPLRRCDAMVTQGVALAASDRSAAESALLLAVSRCPEEPAGYRELSGLRLLERRWPESVALAEAALARDSADPYAIDLLAVGRLALGDRVGALQAWSLKGGLTIDSIRITGLRRTRQPVVMGLAGVEPGQRLTASRMDWLTRRLEELPTAGRQLARYTTTGTERAVLDLAATERRVLPTDFVGLATIAGEALLTRTIRVNVAAPLRHGDLWQPAFRWPDKWRRVGLDLSLPLGQRAPGVVSVEMFEERQTYQLPVGDTTRTETRRRFAGSWADWVAAPIRVEAGASSDRYDGERHFSVFTAAILRLAGDRIAARARAERWMGSDVRDGFAAVATSVDWRSHTRAGESVWTARAGWSNVSDAAPLAVWPGAGAMLDRTTLLRGRRLVASDVVAGPVFGRQLAYFTVERHDPLISHSLGTVSLATFVDTARAWKRLDRSDPSDLHIDVGAGLRAAQTGDDNVLRVDIGVGLRDGNVRVSAGYVTGWGRP
jgi:hypothetical protein